MAVSTPYGRVMSLITAPQVSMRTVLATSGEPSVKGLVRETNVGVRSIFPNVAGDMPCCLRPCRTAPNQVRMSPFKDRPLLMNSIHPVWIRKLVSATMFSIAVRMAQTKMAWEKICDWMGNHHDG